MNFELWHTPKVAAKILGRQPSTLRIWRLRGVGPAFRDCYGSPRYARSVLLEFKRQEQTEILRSIYGDSR
jgi:hypothetical protein